MVMKSINSLGEFVNLPELLDRVENDQELLARIVCVVSGGSSCEPSGLQTAIHGDDLREIERTAHRLKGMLANLSAKQAASLAAEIESTARAGNAAKIRELMSMFDPQISCLFGCAGLVDDECMKMRILIADDDALSLRLLEKTLERAGYEVTAVKNGRRAAEEMCRPKDRDWHCWTG